MYDMKIGSLLKFSKVMSKNKVFAVYLLGLWCVHAVSALKITSLDVPKTAWDSVKLNCRYDLEDGTLYAVKWYKDNREFFRCMSDGTVQQFPLADISVYHTGRSQTGSCFFELTALTSKSGGEYSCEVSLDWPTFQVESKTAYLQVVEPSRIVQPEEPTIEDQFALLNKSAISQASSPVPSMLNTVIFILFVIYNI